MAERVINLIKGDKAGSETDYRDSLAVNMVAVKKPLFGVNGYMIQCPGLVEYAAGFGVDRGGIWNERFQLHFRVSGNDFISVDKDGIVMSLGTVPGNDTVSLPYSFLTQGIVANGQFFLYDPTNGFREVTDPDLGDPIDAVWVDGYYFFTDGEFIYHSDINDESAIDPLKFATSEYSPDPTLGVALTPDNKVMVFNRYTTEYFINVAQDNFAFQRVPNRAVIAGIVGTHCKAPMQDRWVILGGRKEEAVSVHVIGVGSVTKIASREVDKVIGQYTEEELSESVVETRSEDGQSFVIVHLPNEVLQYNVTLGDPAIAWTILKSDVVGDAPWRAKHGVFEAQKGVWVYGDKINNKIGVLDETVATQYDDIIEWTLDTPYEYLESGSINKIEIETVPGFTDTNDATVFMSLTYDGVTHSSEHTIDYGLPGAYSKRFIKYRLGYVNNWMSIRLRGATRSRMAFSRAIIDVS